MSEAITIKLTPQAEALLRTVQELPSWGMDAVCIGMDRANQIALANIQRKHLTGQGPFPVDEHKLGVRSGRLRGAAWASPAVATGTQVSSAIWDNVKYAQIHEFGGTVHHPARTMTLRFATDVHGTLLTQAANSNLRVFANMKKLSKLKTGNKRFKEEKHKAEAYDVEMPERAPFRTGIAEVFVQYSKMVSAELVSAWRTRI